MILYILFQCCWRIILILFLLALFIIQRVNFDISEKLDDSKKKKEKEKEYKIGNYLIKRTLGQGTFGKVKLGIYLPSQEKVAIKILEKDRILEKDDEIRVKREFVFLLYLTIQM